jgi:hypothetical protein
VATDPSGPSIIGQQYALRAQAALARERAAQMRLENDARRSRLRLAHEHLTQVRARLRVLRGARPPAVPPATPADLTLEPGGLPGGATLRQLSVSRPPPAER